MPQQKRSNSESTNNNAVEVWSDYTLDIMKRSV